MVKEWRTLVKVKLGERGIRQSDAFFQHTQVLQQWIDSELQSCVSEIRGVCVATRPRPVQDSYMPVFNAGKLVGSAIATAKGIPFLQTSHQEGHYYAARATAKHLTMDFEPLLFFHLSGGTTELHLVEWVGEEVKMTMVSETDDISIGQLVDRIGVAAGLQFPCGAEMDQKAVDGHLADKLPSFKVKERFNLSGYENYFKALLVKYPDNPEWVYHLLFKDIFMCLSKVVELAIQQTGVNRVLFAGGVAASKNLASHLEKWEQKTGYKCYISHSHYASDNAFGVALIGEELMRRI